MKCPRCGYSDPFLRSWWDPEKEVCDHDHMKEWNISLYQRLLDEKDKTGAKNAVEVDGFIYHLTPQSVERWEKWDWENRGNRIKGYYDKRVGRKNYHILGRRTARKA